jgi:hypothetical protein
VNAAGDVRVQQARSWLASFPPDETLVTLPQVDLARIAVQPIGGAQLLAAFIDESERRPRTRVVTASSPDGTAVLSHVDRLTALGALHVAAKVADETDEPVAVTYRALAFRLGDDR